MESQEFFYLGGGCRSEDFGGEVQYTCRTYDDGPGDDARWVEMYFGDWYDIIEEGDTVEDVRALISEQVESTLSTCNAARVRLLSQKNVDEGRILLNPLTVTDPACLADQDPNKLTYVVYENDDIDDAQVLMKSSWKWNCNPTGNDFFPMEAEYSVYDNFANLELIRFESTKYGTIEEGPQNVQFEYTFESMCDVPGAIVEFDRQLCARECDDSKDDDWNCPEVARKDGCVMDESSMSPCMGSTAIPADGSVTITDKYERTIPVGPTYEFQLNLFDISVEFNDDMTKTSDREQEVFEFCVPDSRSGGGTGGSGGGGSAAGGAASGSGKLA